MNDIYLDFYKLLMCFAITEINQNDMVFIKQSFNLTFDNEWKTSIDLDGNKELVGNNMVNIVVLHSVQLSATSHPA